ncbi:hypothetical protein A6B39_05185 [Mannheimia granulomatis]|uniref:hypothetical protein n=1 Tax=Mannheimia granulomatis TaxID=85402 RepID=UPI00159E434E|nr:hypothetical protein [Mannheimia granulomatis]QLB14890.1 hypothetical protein A6B39_05185 [Mannheimia granulomatis]
MKELEQFNKLINSPIYKEFMKVNALYSKLIPQEINAINQQIKALTANFPLSNIKQWQSILEESNSPEDFAVFNTPAYDEIEKRVEKGVATDLEKEIAQVGQWAKLKGKIVKNVAIGIAVIGSINTIFDFVEHIEKRITYSSTHQSTTE